MPKAVVYVRADDARAIEQHEQVDIADWVRDQVAKAIAEWRREQIERER